MGRTVGGWSDLAGQFPNDYYGTPSASVERPPLPWVKNYSDMDYGTPQ